MTKAYPRHHKAPSEWKYGVAIAIMLAAAIAAFMTNW